jgi:hypothetical protein
MPALRLGPLRIPWPGSAAKDPYWDAFINRAPSDPRNALQEVLANAAGGAVNPNKVELHTPEITAAHLRELATFLGAEQIGIVRLKDAEPADAAESADSELGTRNSELAAERYPFAIVCAVKADYDPRTARGVGGQVPVRNGLFVTFTLAAYIREMGYRATNQEPADEQRLAAAAGLGTLNAQGRLVPTPRGAHVHIADEVVHTDLPLAPDGEV